MRFLERRLIGKFVELAVIRKKRNFLLGRSQVTALFAEKHGSYQFVIKWSSWGSAEYDSYSSDEARQLKDALSRYEELCREYEDGVLVGLRWPWGGKSRKIAVIRKRGIPIGRATSTVLFAEEHGSPQLVIRGFYRALILLSIYVWAYSTPEAATIKDALLRFEAMCRERIASA